MGGALRFGFGAWGLGFFIQSVRRKKFGGLLGPWGYQEQPRGSTKSVPPLLRMYLEINRQINISQQLNNHVNTSLINHVGKCTQTK